MKQKIIRGALITSMALAITTGLVYSDTLNFYSPFVATANPDDTVEIKFESKLSCENVRKVLKERLLKAGKVILKDKGCVAGRNSEYSTMGSIIILKH